MKKLLSFLLIFLSTFFFSQEYTFDYSVKINHKSLTTNDNEIDSFLFYKWTVRKKQQIDGTFLDFAPAFPRAFAQKNCFRVICSCPLKLYVARSLKTLRAERNYA